LAPDRPGPPAFPGGEMKIGTIIQIFGLINLALVFFQVSTGLRIFKVPFSVHKKTGLLLLVSALIHGGMAIYYN
jgi:hypothetical protein